MSVLSRIRSRAGLLVAVIGIALFAFILGDIFTSGRSIFSSRETNVGIIAGEEITILDFQTKLEEQIKQIKDNNPNSQIDDATRDQVVQQIWNQMVTEKIFNREFDKAGISVPTDELTDRMFGKDPDPVLNQYFQDPQTKRVRKDFAMQDGSGRLDTRLVKKYVAGLTEKDEKYWIQMEKYIRDNRRQVKYMNMIKKGLYVTTAQARQDSADAALVYNIRYIAKKYNTASDSAIKVTDEDLLTWYNAHQYKYKVKEATRNIEFLSFDIKPSAKDISELKTELSALVPEFKVKTGKDDSSFVQAESDARRYNVQYIKRGVLKPDVDTVISKGIAGTVVGPVEENGKMILYKVLGNEVASDSAKVRHLLVAYKGPASRDSTITRTKEQAHHRADSLFNLVKTKKKKLEELIDQFSDDGGKKAPSGDGHEGVYGYFTQEAGMVPEFKKAGLEGKKGDITVVETIFGYHIIEVLDNTKKLEKTLIVTIERQINASKTTVDSVYLKANTFAGKNVTTELFEKAAANEHLQPNVAQEIHATDHTINGLESPKELIHWVFADERKKNEVSQPYQLGERFVIATLTSIKEKGIAPLVEVKDKVTMEVKKQKKAEKFMDDMARASAGVTKIDDLAAKLREPAQTAENINFSNSFIPGIGQEQGLIGSVVCRKADSGISKPVQGNNAVYVFSLEKVGPVGMTPDSKTMKKSKLQMLQSSVEQEVQEILKENAKIKDNRAKFF
ncbi:MAG: SurA N-terminal domain-containing protein [Bacteroidia bacterium]